MFVIQLIIELAVVFAILYGILNEDLLVDFEQNTWNCFCRYINKKIRSYEDKKRIL